MKHRIEGSRLILSIDASERAALLNHRSEYPDDFGTTQHELEVMEPLLCNSELSWINPADTGDLTDAPMLGIMGPDVPGCDCEGWTFSPPQHPALSCKPIAWVQCGQDRETKYFQPILHRWAFMSYALRSFLSDLADTGEAVFES